MSTFLTPPVWYDKNGNLNQMLTGNPGTSRDIAIGAGTTATGGGIAIKGNAGDGGIAIGGTSNGVGIAIGGSSNGEGIAIGYISASSNDGVAIGYNTKAKGSGCIAIGDGANTNTPNTIQLGNNNTAYTLNVGNGTGTSKIGALNFNEVASTDIQSNGLYLCTATKTQTVSSETTIFGFSAFLWIETSKSTVVSTTDGSATFTYDKPEGQSNWAIRVSGADSDTLKCYRVFSL